jgi:sulfate permease, SulP family
MEKGVIGSRPTEGPMGRRDGPTWLRHVPAALWLADYRSGWLAGDIVAGVTLAAYAIPVALAYAGLAGLPPQVGVYGYLLGGLGYALLGSSRQLAIGPTSAISLMIAGTVGAMAGGDAERYGQIASLAGFTVALLCLIGWLLRLSGLVRLISDSILVGFKAGAGLTIAMSQLPSLFGVSGGGQNFFERMVLLAGQFGQIHYLVFALGVVAILLLVLGERFLPGRPVGLVVLRTSGTGGGHDGRTSGGPALARPPSAAPAGCGGDRSTRSRMPVACLSRKCVRRTYLRGEARIHPRPASGISRYRRGQPRSGAGSWLSRGRRPVPAGARTPLSLVFASLTLSLCLVFLTGLLEKPAEGSAIVLTAVYGLIDFPTMLRMWRVSRMDFYAAAIALGAVLLLGILQGILLAALTSVLMLLARASSPHVAFLGRIPGASGYSDLARHPENEPLPNVIAFRPEASLLYVNADSVLEAVSRRLEAGDSFNIHMVVCDLSASPHVDLAGSRMLHQLHAELARRGIALSIVGARGRVRDLPRADGIGEKVGGLDRLVTLNDVLGRVR